MCARESVALRVAVLLLVCGVVVPSSSFALPWDVDMYRQASKKPGEMVRAPVPGTVPVGRRPFTMTVEEADKSLKNPVAFSRESVWRGKRLWNANCSSCHGLSGASDSEVAKVFLGIPNLLGDLYKQRSDGRIFGVIYHGQNSMPRYGYKFSADEQWDIVNYLRFLQGRDVEGIERPQAKVSGTQE